MAKLCPVTGSYVLYLDCLECDSKEKCRKDGNKENEDNIYDSGKTGVIREGKKPRAENRRSV